MNSYPDTGDPDTDESPCDESPNPETPCRPCAPDPDDCDSKSIARVRCHAFGIDAQAAFNKEYQPPLDTAHDTYNTARGQYRQTRADVSCKVRDLKHEIACLIERIRCLIKQHHVIECLDEAFDCVTCELEKCDKRTPPLDCCFDESCDAPLEAITQRIVEYTAKLDKAKDRFGWLAGESGRLKQRVDDAEAEVKAVQDALKADPAVTDPKKLYVQAIVAWYHLKHVWGDYPTVGSFIDALCGAMTCWRDAVVAVSVLVRCQAELQCHRDAKDKECDRLKQQTVDEILVVYERLCGHSHHDDDDDDCGYGRGKGSRNDEGSRSDERGEPDDEGEPDPPSEEPGRRDEGGGRYGSERYRDDERRYRDDERGMRRRRAGFAD